MSPDEPPRGTTLRARAWLDVTALELGMALLLFSTAGTFAFWQAWVFLAVFLACSALVTRDLLRNDPALLDRRMRVGPRAETEPVQKVIMGIITGSFVALLALGGLERRLTAPALSPGISVAGDFLLALGFLGAWRVYRANTFTSATVTVTPAQTVVDTGPYAVVRHPLYASAFLYFAGVPLALGSRWGLGLLVVPYAALIWRIVAEERMLARDLAGYREYQRKVRYRLIPGVW